MGGPGHNPPQPRRRGAATLRRMLEACLLSLLGLAVGSIGTWVGVGGGFLLVPVLTLVYPHWPHPTVVAVSLVVVFVNGISGSAGYLAQRPRRVAVLPGAVFAAATIPGAVAGALAVQSLPRATFQLVLAGVLLAGAAMLLVVGGRAGLKRRETARRRRLGIPDDAHDPIPPLTARGWTTGVALSVGIGFLAALVGIGGGVFHVPALVFILDFPVHAATATSQFILAITSGAASVTNIHGGLLDGAWSVALPIAGGAVVGAQLGVRLARASNPAGLVRGLAVVIAAAGVALAVRAISGP